MADEAIADDTIVGTEQTTPEVGTEQTTPEIDYKTEYETNKALVEKLKADNAGLDRKIGELSNAQKELLKKTETADETAERERLDRENKDKEERILRDKEKTETLSEINKLKVEREALKQGFTDEEIEELGFKDIESVTKYKAFMDRKILLAEERKTKNIESALSGNRDSLNGNTKVDNMPKALSKAFD
jgi:predicted RNase H-like nuclease (RuvC/YqgF family)